MTVSTTVKTGKDRIPTLLGKQAIFMEFLSTYLDALDEISEYNTQVLVEKDSEWNSYKILEKARELARPSTGEANSNIKEALEAWETLASEVNRVKQTVLQVTAKELGIDYAAGAERNPEVEAPLRDKRKTAINIGVQLTQMAGMSMDSKMKDAIVGFLNEYEMPSVGRNQVHSFTAEPNNTPKYRVRISVARQEDGEVLFAEEGITKTVQALTKYYPRGKSLKADTFRSVWEKAGNTMEATPVPTVEFTDNDLVFTITKK